MTPSGLRLPAWVTQLAWNFLLRQKPDLAPHQVELVVEEVLVVGAYVQLRGQAVLRVEPAPAHIQLDLAHRDAHAVRACAPQGTHSVLETYHVLKSLLLPQTGPGCLK